MESKTTGKMATPTADRVGSNQMAEYLVTGRERARCSHKAGVIGPRLSDASLNSVVSCIFDLFIYCSTLPSSQLSSRYRISIFISERVVSCTITSLLFPADVLESCMKCVCRCSAHEDVGVGVGGCRCSVSECRGSLVISPRRRRERGSPHVTTGGSQRTSEVRGAPREGRGVEAVGFQRRARGGHNDSNNDCIS